MASPKVESKRRVSQRERELKQVTKCLRQRLAWCNRTGQTYDPSNEQYSTYPRAICEETGAPHKGSKAVWTDKLEKRYSTKTCESTPVITHVLPRGWVPEVIILDAMFLIQCSPLRQTMTIMDYAKLLLNRFVLQHYQAGVRYMYYLIVPVSNTSIPKSMSKKGGIPAV